jgi:hypothetical protein
MHHADVDVVGAIGIFLAEEITADFAQRKELTDGRLFLLLLWVHFVRRLIVPARSMRRLPVSSRSRHRRLAA